MRKPWQIWFVFTVTVSVVLSAMIWLSVKAVEVDRDRERDRRETEMARQEAELQERINSALVVFEFFPTHKQNVAVCRFQAALEFEIDISRHRQ